MNLIRFRHILQISFFMFSITIITINSEVFTAIADMEELLETESVLISNLQVYVDAQKTKIDYLTKKVDEYQEKHTEASADISSYLSNPINAYLLTKRLTSDWKQLENLLSYNLGDEFLKNITNYHNVLKFPSDEDLNGAAVALMRLQDIYKLPTENIARGELNGVQYSTEMSSNDCFEIGRQSYINGNYHLAASWMNEAMDRLTKEAVNQTSSTSRAEILMYLSFSAYKRGDISSASTIIDELLELIQNQEDGLEFLHPHAKEISEILDMDSKEYDGSDEVDNAESPMRVDTNPFPSDLKMYEMLCRSEIQPTPKQLRPLRCRYIDNNMPYLKIGPFKIEEVNLSPYIVVFHEVMYDNEIEVAKKMAKPRLNPVFRENSETDYSELTPYSTRKVARLDDKDYNYNPRIVRRVRDMTGLDMTTSEDLQVVNYGVGGHYEPHYDFAHDKEDGISYTGWGNRIATVLFYMSDVEQGGATVFPKLRTAVWPKKGAAVFWFNLYSSGEGDYKTLHGACPVLTGTKWVSNFWIHERGQEFIRKCELEKEPTTTHCQN